MTRETLPGTPPIEVTLRRSRRARRLSLRVSSLDGRVTLTMPEGASRAVALDFVRDRHDWIAAARAKVPDIVRVVPGAVLPIENRPVPVIPAVGGRSGLSDRGLAVPETNGGRTAAAVLKVLARDRLAAAADAHAAALGVGYRALALRDTRSRWGSCTADGRLMFSWRLILAPPEVLNYVAVHEVAHLVRMDHSAAFWASVARLCPDWGRHRDWLRAEGSRLHRFRFED